VRGAGASGLPGAPAALTGEAGRPGLPGPGLPGPGLPLSFFLWMPSLAASLRVPALSLLMPWEWASCPSWEVPCGVGSVYQRVQRSRQVGRRLASGGGSGSGGGALAPFPNRASMLPQVHPAPSKAG
jgi:hypothetical protein